MSTLSTSLRGRQSLSDLPLTQFLHLTTTTTTTFLSKPPIPIPPAHPHLSFLWPSICQNPWHLIPNLILPLTALVNLLLLSFLPSLSLTLGYHFPLSALCVKASGSALFLAYISAMCLHRRNLRITQGPVAGNIFLFFLLSSVTVCHLHTRVICLPAFLQSRHHQFFLSSKTPFPSPQIVLFWTLKAAWPFPSYFVQTHNFPEFFSVTFSHWGF